MKDDSVNLSVAIDVINRKIAEINIKIINENDSEKNKKELEKYLKMREELFCGNVLLVDKIINSEI